MQNGQVSASFWGFPPKELARVLSANERFGGSQLCHYFLHLPAHTATWSPVRKRHLHRLLPLSFLLSLPSLPVYLFWRLSHGRCFVTASVSARLVGVLRFGHDGRGRRRRGGFAFGQSLRCRRSAVDQPISHTRTTV